MVGEDRVMMSSKELRRVHVIRHAMAKRTTQVKAGALLGLTTRQVRRLMQRVEQEGDQGLAHRGRGRPSNRRIAESVKAKVLRLYERRYGDFGPTGAAEKVTERHELVVSAETLRTWLLERGVQHFRRRKRPHRTWRARKAHVGELVQLDGSHHDGLEGRGPRCVLMAYIDDASSRVSARFYEYEGTHPRRAGQLRALWAALGAPAGDLHGQAYDLPVAGRADGGREQLEGRPPQSQFERCLAEWGVKVLHAHSPPAKGRVARLFATFQDRLIKELRLARITTLEAANRFVDNQRFAVQPAPATDLHRPVPTGQTLDRILSLKIPRVLRRDWTVAHNGHLDQVQTNVRATHVMVEERVDGTIQITHHGRPLGYHAIMARPMKAAEGRPVHQSRHPVTPRPDHPWRKRLPERRTPAATAMT
jgi:Helix-turn-helix domain